tara:strand:- start:6719 stop:7171 length:453 start_codon:yes stop_codon:yes gene_type:complete
LESIDTSDDPAADQIEGETFGQVSDGLISRDDFFGTFCAVFMIGYLPAPAPLPLHSLPIKQEEMAAARGASDTLYEIISEIHFLRWVLSPEGVWAKRLTVIGAFAIPKAMSVMAELSQKAAAKRMEEARDVTPVPKPAPMPAGSSDTQSL